MVNQRFSPKVIKIFKITLILIAIIVTFIIYKLIATKNNAKKYKNYLLENGFTLQEDKSYYKQTVNNNIITNYYVYNDTAILIKEIINNTKHNKDSLSLSYNNDNTITGTYSIDGTNQDGNYDSSVQKSKYNIKTKEYSCEIIIDGHFDTKCDNIKNETIKFEKEVQEILKQNNLNSKYIK